MRWRAVGIALMAASGVIAFLTALVLITRFQESPTLTDAARENFHQQLDAKGISLVRFDADYPETIDCRNVLQQLESIVEERTQKRLPTFRIDLDLATTKPRVQALCNEWTGFRNNIKSYVSTLRRDAEDNFQPYLARRSPDREHALQRILSPYRELSTRARDQLDRCPKTIRGHLDEIESLAARIGIELTHNRNPKTAVGLRALHHSVDAGERAWSEFCRVPTARLMGNTPRPSGLWYDIQQLLRAHPMNATLLLGMVGSGLFGWSVFPLLRTKKFPEDIRLALVVSFLAAAIAFGVLKTVFWALGVVWRGSGWLEPWAVLLGCLAAAIYAERILSRFAPTLMRWAATALPPRREPDSPNDSTQTAHR